jgi:hypothetical protein
VRQFKQCLAKPQLVRQISSALSLYYQGLCGCAKHRIEVIGTLACTLVCRTLYSSLENVRKTERERSLKPVGAVLGFQGFWASFPGYVSPHEVWH